MEIQLKFAAASDVGLLRKSNQDSGYTSPNLFAVADGMGGAAAGDLASAVTIAHLRQADGVYPPEELLPRLRQALNNAHAELVLRTAKEPQLAGMGTTCIACLRSGNKLAMVHIGDSRAYLLRKQQLTQITHDHTLVQYLVDTGQISAAEAENHPKRNVIMRALGDDPQEQELALDESLREALPGDRWLLCSDGLYGPVPFELIHRTLNEITDLDECAAALVGHALAAGAPDNVTVVLADVVVLADGTAADAPLAPAQIVGAAAARKIKLHHSDALAAVFSAPTAVAGNVAENVAENVRTPETSPGAHLSQLGGKALVNAPDDPQLHAVNSALNGAIPALAAKQETPVPQNDHTNNGAFAAVTLSASEQAAFFAEKQVQKRSWKAKLALLLGVLVLISGGLFGAYAWTQTKYYVAPAQGYLGIYRGVPTEIGPLKLSHLTERSQTRISELSDFVQTRLETPITRDSLSEAREVLRSLAAHKKQESSN